MPAENLDREKTFACADCVGRGVITLTTEGRHTTVYRTKGKSVRDCMGDKCPNIASYVLYSYPDRPKA